MPFEKVKGNLGFGAMRLKMTDDKVDYGEFNKMIDAFIDAGFNYFDTAHGYIDGKSEIALRECLVSRYDREDYVLADKLSAWLFEKEEDIMPMFNKQLECCGVDYFDFYLFHCINNETYPKHKRCNSFDVIRKLKEQGKIKHIGMSFHDTADYLDTVLTEQPWIEFVQLQFNYLDYDDPGVQSKKCYDVAVKHNKKVIVMEPVKGGYLATLPDKAAEVFPPFGNKTHASYALRFAASFEGVFMVLSGMGDMAMMNDNISTFKPFIPMSEQEMAAAHNAREIIREVRQIQCTKCNYCADVCPKNIPISETFASYNALLAAKKTRAEAKNTLPVTENNAASCIKCGECEKVCPQKITIRTHLEKITRVFKLNK